MGGAELEGPGAEDTGHAPSTVMVLLIFGEEEEVM